jgi:hypothetical protein
MKRSSFFRLWLPLLVLVTIVAVFRAGSREGVHISGDLAGDLVAALAGQLPDTVFAPAPNGAQIEIIAVTDWAKLAFVEGARAACGVDCSPESANFLVRVIRLTPGGPRKLIFLNIDPALSAEAIEAGIFAFSEQGLKCMGAVLAAEIQSLRGGGNDAGCIGQSRQATRWTVFRP